MVKPKEDVFLNSADFLIESFVEVLIFSMAGGAALWFRTRFHPSILVTLILIYIFQVVITLIVLKVLRAVFPVQEGAHRYVDRSRTCYVWNLYSFLSMVNLGLLYTLPTVPIPFKMLLYQLLGTKMKGYASISGRLCDPYLISVGEDAIIGDDALLLPHLLNIKPEKTLVLERIEIHDRAIVGTRSVLLPGVCVGESAVVAAMSLVPRHTKIPPYEIWGGVPAKKIGELPRPTGQDK